ncbi:MAG: chemotaxis protein CheB [Planctomycetota bacterium]|jgi:two-component system CheB/CheR fusion protein
MAVVKKKTSQKVVKNSLSPKKTATKNKTKRKPAGKKATKSISQKKIDVEIPQGPSVPIVGMGASAGGLQAFEEFFHHMPANSGMAFVMVSHLDPDRVSILHELFKKSTAMPVEQIADGTTVEANRVYVIPPGKDLAIMNGILYLMKPAQPHGARLPIDYFFRSLADDQHENAIGIILSGNGSDGALGIKAIKGESGLVMAQDPETAKFPSMPSSAIATGLVDFVLPAGQMPKQLISYTKGPHLKTAEVDLMSSAPLPVIMKKIFVLLRSRTGHDFSYYKTSTLRRRIIRRMNIHQIKTHKNYLRYLEENPQEVDLLFKELLIGVTNFFRDPQAFDVLAANSIPNLLKARTDDKPLRVWVPGCSTGEEAYSVSIMLREAMARHKKPCEIQIFATDLDTQAIETARVGMYPDGIASDVNPKRLKKYFVKDNDHYRIRKEIRETVVFALQNLIKDPPFTRLDLLSCRNLLIYLQPEMQKRLLPLFHHALKPDGILFLGTSESTSGFSHLFKTIDKKWKVFQRKEGISSVQMPAEVPLQLPAKEPEDIDSYAYRGKDIQPNIAEQSSKLLTERYAPPSVLINEQGEIIYIHGKTGLYLQPAPGQPTHNIHTMAREGLQLALAAAVRKAINQDGEVVHKDVQIKANGGHVSVDLKVSRIATPESLRGLLLVTFDSTSRLEPESTAKVKRAPKKKRRGREAELETELQYTKSNLQSTIEELETSNEELKSTNEELQSTNEELQSTNEELETSKEEMQSLNEELQTVNVELQGKIEALSQANDDMANLLNATDVATIFLDNDLNIKRFTTQASKVIRLIHSDIGRPIADIVSKLNYQSLERDVNQVLKTLTYKEKEVQCEDDTWFQMRIMPYRTADNLIDGVVLTFIDIDINKRSEIKLQEAHNKLQKQIEIAKTAQGYAESIVESVREPLIILDEKLCIVSANQSFYTTFDVSKEQTVGQTIYDLVNRQWDIPKLRELLEDVLPQNSKFDNYKVEHDFPSVGHKVMLLNARRLEQSSGLPGRILLAIEDIT